MVDNPKVETVKHIHTTEETESYEKEIGLINLNYSVLLKSNHRKDSLKGMVKLGINTLNKMKKMEVEK